MEHEKQVVVVKQALELETQIQVLEQFLPEERAETYAEPEPQPPVRTVGPAALSSSMLS